MRHNPTFYRKIGGVTYRVKAKKRKPAVVSRKRRSTKRRKTSRAPVVVASRTTAGKTDSSFLGIGMLGLIAIGGVAFLLLRKKETVVVPMPVVNSGTPFPMQQQPTFQLTPEQQGQNLYAAVQMMKAQ